MDYTKVLSEQASRFMDLTEDSIILKESNDKIYDEVGEFWVVTKPSSTSRLIDICFESDIFDMSRQISGGLTESEVYGFYKSEEKAKEIANKLLSSR